VYTSAINTYGRIFGAFNEAGIRYIVVGGVAMNLLGYSRFTGYIDILLALDKENLARMARLMESMGYERRLPVRVDALGDEKKVLSLMKSKHLIAYTFANPEKPQFSVDVIVGDSLKFDAYAKHAISVSVWNIAVPVVSIDDLIRMKKRSNRKKDAADVQMLLEFKGL
jgi:hypothetical protein